MGLASSEGMVVEDMTTMLAHASRAGKRRVHFIITVDGPGAGEAQAVRSEKFGHGNANGEASARPSLGGRTPVRRVASRDDRQYDPRAWPVRTVDCWRHRGIKSDNPPHTRF